MVLHEKGVGFETHEVDLENKSEEFLKISPTGKVPVVVVEGDVLYESNVVNQYLDEVADGPELLPRDPKERAYARIWMSHADSDFYPAVFVASVGRERGFSEERVAEALQKLEETLGKLEERLSGPRVPGRAVLPGRHSARGKHRPPARARSEGRDLPRRLPKRPRLGRAGGGPTELRSGRVG